MRENELAAVQHLIAPVVRDAIVLAKTDRVLAINMCADPDVLQAFDGCAVDYVQPLFTEAKGLQQAGCAVVTVDQIADLYDAVFIHTTKNKIESQYWIALALQHLRAGGVLVCCAHNKAGGTRLAKLFQAFGAQHVDALSGKKCRVVWSDQWDIDTDFVESCVDEGAMQRRDDLQAWSQAGLYGWNKIDRGSALLLQHLPEKISGRRFADFGCGYGYLSCHLAPRLPQPSKLYVLDVDQRAVVATVKNLADHSGVEPVWMDIVAGSDMPSNLDMIIMNPPFHEGKLTDSGIGQAFIKRAAQSLRTGGRLYMVANAHLPYEDGLRQSFTSIDKIYEGDGFKIFTAVK